MLEKVRAILAHYQLQTELTPFLNTIPETAVSSRCMATMRCRSGIDCALWLPKVACGQ
jgi:hypothetical protein